MNLITDGLPAYPDAYKREFWTLGNPRTQHVRVPNKRNRSNNKMVERLHGTLKDRTKPMRGFKSFESNAVNLAIRTSHVLIL